MGRADQLATHAETILVQMTSPAVNSREKVEKYKKILQKQSYTHASVKMKRKMILPSKIHKNKTQCANNTQLLTKGKS